MAQCAKYFFLLGGLILLCYGSSFAQQHNFIQFTKHDGLPTNYVYGVVEDERGYIWAYTENGLARFDGYDFEHFSGKQGLPGQDVPLATKGPDHRIWLWIYKNKPAYLEGDSIHTFYPQTATSYTGRLGDQIIYASGNGYLNFDTTEDSLYQNPNLWDYHAIQGEKALFGLDSVKALQGSEWTDPALWQDRKVKSVHQDSIYYYRYSLGSTDLTGGLRMRSGYLYYYGKSNRIWWRKGKNRKNFKVTKWEAPEIRGSWRTHQLGKQDRFVLSVRSNRFLWVDIETEKSKLIDLREHGPKSERFTTITVLDSSFLVSSDIGFWEFDFEGKLLDTLFLPQLSTQYHLGNSYKDSKGNIWIGSREGGLFMLPAQNRESIRLHNIAYPNDVAFERLLETPTGKLLAFSDNTGIYEINEQSVRNILPPSGLRFRSVAQSSGGIIASSNHKSYWLKEYKDQVQIQPIEEQFNLVDTDSGLNYLLKHQNLLSIAYNPGENTWYGSRGNPLFLLRAQKRNETSIQLDTMQIAASVLHFDSFRNRILAGNTEGIFELKGRNLHPIIESNPAIQNVSALYSTQDQCWIGTESNGLFVYQYEGGQLTHPTQTPNIRNIRPYTDSTLLVASNEGLLIIPKTGKPLLKSYGFQSGLFSDEVWDAWYDGKETIYVATANGIHQVFPHRFTQYAITPERLQIQRMTVNRQQIPFSEGIETSHRENNIEIHYQLLAPSSNGAVSYQARLEPLETEWQTTPERKINYLALPSGEYKFSLQAQDYFGNVYTHSGIQIIIHKPFWQTIVFRLVAFGLIALIVLAFFYLRERRLQKSLAEQQKQTRRIAQLELSALMAQMNPHFVFNALGAIQYYIQTNEVESADAYLTQFALLMRKYLNSAQEKLVPLKEEIELIRLYTQLEKLRFEELFSVEIQVPPGLVTEDILIPSMLIQPFIENAINHGLNERRDGHGKLKISFFYDQNTLFCHISDNGIGRKNAGKLRRKGHRSRGTKLIEEKIETLRESGLATIEIDTQDLDPGNLEFPGTLVRIKMDNLEDDHV